MKKLLVLGALALSLAVPGNVVFTRPARAGKQFICVQPQGRGIFASKCLTLFVGDAKYQLHELVWLHYDNGEFKGITQQ